MIPADETLHGFVQAFDMNFMRDALELHMPTLGSIASCRIERFRYRKQNRATFLYEIETSTGRNLRFSREIILVRNIGPALAGKDISRVQRSVRGKWRMDKIGTNKVTIDEINRDQDVPIKVRTVKHLNHIVAHDPQKLIDHY